MTLRTAEEIIEDLDAMSRQERAKLRNERAERTRKRTGILLRIERLELFRCERCKGHEPGNMPSLYFKCDCTAAVEIRKLGKELDRLNAPVKVMEQRGGVEFSKDIVDKAKRNGIDYETFYKRVVYYEWDEERAATEPKNKTGRTAKVALWTDEMTEIVERETKAGLSIEAIWRKHFTEKIGMRAFYKKCKGVRDALMGGLRTGSAFTPDELERIRVMLIDGAKRRDILAAFPHVSENTVDYRITRIKKVLREEGLL